MMFFRALIPRVGAAPTLGWRAQPRWGWLIPHITLVEFDSVLSQKRSQFVLETHLLVVLLLTSDVAFHPIELRLADREVRVTALPLEVGIISALCLEPAIRDSFEFFHPLCLRDGSSETGKNMNVIFHATDQKRGTFQAFGHSAQVGMHRFTGRVVSQERASFFGGENEMDIYSG
jgi:hypothetical protein